MQLVPIRPLFAPAQLAQLRRALSDYTVDGVHELIGLAGRSALSRGDLTGVARRLGADPLSDLVRLFLLGQPVPDSAAARALVPLDLSAAEAGGLLARSAGEIRARLDLRPYAEDRGLAGLSASGDPSWWVLSDFGSDVRPEPLAADHVLGIGAAALTLAQATVRPRVDRALDIGTGCGVQALHLSDHAAWVTATDISTRALRLAATSAALNGLDWDLRAGSLLDPVAGERFDLVVSNPPFVVSPGGPGGFDYRDSGLSGDAVSRELIQRLPAVLTDGGTAQLLANWVITSEQSWAERVGGWLAGRGCDAWVWQREVAEPGEYVALWLRDAGEVPGTPRWRERYDAWCDWLERSGVSGIGMGLVSLRRTGSESPVVICEDVPQPVEQPSGPAIAGWFERAAWLRDHDADRVLDARLRAAPDIVLTSHARPGPAGWSTELRQLRLGAGMRWELEVDAEIAAVVAGCDGQQPLRTLLGVLAAALGRPAPELHRAAGPVIVDLIRRGLLLPDGAVG